MAKKPRSIRIAGATAALGGVAAIGVAFHFRADSAQPWYLLTVCAGASSSAVLGVLWGAVSVLLFVIRREAIARGLLGGGPIAPPAFTAPRRGTATRPGPRTVPDPRGEARAQVTASCHICGGGRAGFYCGAHKVVLCAGCVSAHLIANDGGDLCSVAVIAAGGASAIPPRAEGIAP